MSSQSLTISGFGMTEQDILRLLSLQFSLFSIQLLQLPVYLFFFFLIYVHCKHKTIDHSSTVQKRALNCKIFMEFQAALYPAWFPVVISERLIPERHGSVTVTVSYPSFLCRYFTYPRPSKTVVVTCVYAYESSSYLQHITCSTTQRIVPITYCLRFY